MPYLLNFLYLLLIVIASPWLVLSALRKGKYREGYSEKLFGLVPRRMSNKKCLWLHAVSVGEVNLLAPLLRMIAREEPEWECVISTTTKAGMELARKKYPGHTVFYCPLDFTWAVNGAVRRAAGCARAGRIGTLAKSRLGRAAEGRPHSGDQRAIEPAEFSRLPPRLLAGFADAIANRPLGRAG